MPGLASPSAWLCRSLVADRFRLGCGGGPHAGVLRGRHLRASDCGGADGVAKHGNIPLPVCPATGFLRLHGGADAVCARHLLRRCPGSDRSAIRRQGRCLYHFGAAHAHLAGGLRAVCRWLLRVAGCAFQQAPERGHGLSRRLRHIDRAQGAGAEDHACGHAFRGCGFPTGGFARLADALHRPGQGLH